MLPASMKEGIKKAASAISSGKMKPGDSMIMRPKEDVEDVPDSDEVESDESSGYDSMAEDMMKCFEEKDTKGLAALLEELCDHAKS